jgi:hypothetical protein
MTSFGRVKLSKVWRMLKKCAGGYRAIEQGHKWRVEYRDRTFPDLPLGDRTSRMPEVELGVLKKMIRHLQLDPDCVHRHLPQIPKGWLSEP